VPGLLFKTFSVSRNFCEFGKNCALFSRAREKIGLAGYFVNQAQIVPAKTISVAVSLRRSKAEVRRQKKYEWVALLPSYFCL
jgi:hypothetical protein